MAGYSGTPLAAKLGIKPGAVVTVIGAPPTFAPLLEPMPADVTMRPALRGHPDVICFFTTSYLKQVLAARRERAYAHPS